MGSLTIALIAGAWLVTTLLVLRLFAAASRDDGEDEGEPAAEEERPTRERRFEPQPGEGARDVAAAGRERG
jgi:hypothetical protein